MLHDKQNIHTWSRNTFICTRDGKDKFHISACPVDSFERIFYSEIYIRFVPNIVYKFIYQTLFLFVVNGTWGLWGAWGSCTTTCDDGIWKRYRSCDNPAPAHGGSDCQGSTNATATCYTTCPGTCTVELYLYC